MHIRIGTRGSKLAITQTEIFLEKAREIADFTYDIIIITTTGDKITDRPLYDIGGKALFLKEIEEAMLDGKIDCAIHSMKDVPSRLPEGLIIAAMLAREDPRDVLLSSVATSIMELPRNAKIATSSARRAAQIKLIRPDIEISSLRGNVPTRIEKWKNSDMDAIILAAAGLKRLGLYDTSFCHSISVNEMIPSVCQGVIAIEIKSEDLHMKEICDKINHIATSQAVSAERGFLEYLDADCRTPLAAYAHFISEDQIEARFMLASDDFKTHFFTTKITSPSKAYDAGVRAAIELKSQIK